MLCSCSIRSLSSQHQPQRFSWRPVVSSLIFFCFRFPDNKTDVFNFVYLNSTRLQLLISKNRQDCPLCVFCDYNRNARPNARKNLNASYYNILSTIFGHAMSPFTSLSSRTFQYCVEVVCFWPCSTVHRQSLT